MTGREEFTLEVLHLPTLPSDCGLVTLSPDGNRLACVRPVPDTNFARIWISPVQPVDLQTVGEQMHFPAISLLRWSPDGKRLAWVSHQGMPPGTDHRLWVADVEDAGSVRTIYTATGIISAVCWSPDSALLAIADTEAGVSVCTADEGDVVFVDGSGMGYPLGPNGMAWIGNRHLAYGNVLPGAYGLWLADVASGASRHVLKLDTGEMVIPAWAGEEKWGALRGGGALNGVRLYIWPDLREPPEVYPLPQVKFDLATTLLPSDDGHLWAFTTWGEIDRELWVVSALSGDAWRVDVETVDEVLRWVEKPRRLVVSLLPESQEESERKSAEQSLAEFEFSTEELLYLVGAVGGTGMLGLPDPFLAMTIDEIEERLKVTRDLLVNRGLVRPLPGGGYEVEPSVVALVRTCAFPEKSLMIAKREKDGSIGIWWIHLTSSLIVELKTSFHDKHRLSVIAGGGTLISHLQARLGLTDRRASNGPSLVVAREVLSSARRAGREKGLKAGIQHLRRSNVDEKTAHDLAEALVSPEGYSSLVIVTWKKEHAVLEDGFGILVGPSGPWLLCSVTSSHVEVTPASAATIMRRVEESLHPLVE